MGQLKRWAGLSITCTKCGAVKKVAPSQIARGYYSKNYRCKACSAFIDCSIPDTYDSGYVFGAIVGDGYLWRVRGHRIGLRLDVSDVAFADKFHHHSTIAVGKRGWRGLTKHKLKANPSIKMPSCEIWRHRLVICSRDWCCKAEPLKNGDFSSLTSLSPSFKKGFTQGVIDAEGYERKGAIVIANKDRALLQLLMSFLSEFSPPVTLTLRDPGLRDVSQLYIGVGSGFNKTRKATLLA